MSDEYFSIRKPASGELKDRGSRFIAFAFPVKNEKEIEEALATIRSKHAKARHNHQNHLLQRPDGEGF